MRAPTGVFESASLADLWGPRLISFYYLLCADQALAETLAIETVVELARAGRGHRDTVAIMRCALGRAATLHRNTPAPNDPLVLAVASLPKSHGRIIAAVRGMGIGIADFAEAAGMGLPEAKRCLAESVLEIHTLLSPRRKTEMESSGEI